MLKKGNRWAGYHGLGKHSINSTSDKDVHSEEGSGGEGGSSGGDGSGTGPGDADSGGGGETSSHEHGTSDNSGGGGVKDRSVVEAGGVINVGSGVGGGRYRF